MKLHVAGQQMPVGGEISATSQLISETLKCWVEERSDYYWLLLPSSRDAGAHAGCSLVAEANLNP